MSSTDHNSTCAAPKPWSGSKVDVVHCPPTNEPRFSTDDAAIMKPKTSLVKVASDLLETQNLTLQSCTPIQTLWAGYGHVARITATTSHVSPAYSGQSGSSVQTFILKHVSPPSISAPSVSSSAQTCRNATESSKATTMTVDEGHLRKVLSYQIEQRFYVHLAPLVPKDIAIATCFAHHSPLEITDDNNDGHHTDTVTNTNANANTSTLLLTDLRASFPLAGEDMAELTSQQVHAALDWLANFHGFWWSVVQKGHNGLNWSNCVLSPLQHAAEHGNSSSLECYATSTGAAASGGIVWQRGGYSHLATRRKEYETLKANKRSEWSRKLCQSVNVLVATTSSSSSSSSSSIADLVDQLLYPYPQTSCPSSPYQTLIHGDVKSENLFSSPDGTQVAFYDFQYVGLGLGVLDLAKLLTVSVPVEMLVDSDSDSDSDEEQQSHHAGAADEAGTRTAMAMTKGEEALLRRYRGYLEARSGRSYEWTLFVRHWEAALVDWLRFQASWGFWGNTEWLEGRVRSIVQDEDWLLWLRHAVKPQ